MADWAEGDLEELAETDEVRISSQKRDGSWSNSVPIWVVRIGKSLYVRSGDGPKSLWFARAKASRTSTIASNGLDREVALQDSEVRDEDLNEAYRRKYTISGAEWIEHVTSPLAASTTQELIPVPRTTAPIKPFLTTRIRKESYR